MALPAQPFTLPLPLERDIDIARVVGNLSDKVRNCTTVICNMSISEHKAWMGTSKDVLYIALPIVVGWGLLTGLLSIIVLGRQIKVSNDAYMLCLVTASILLLSCGAVLKLPDYLGPSNTYQYAYGYIKGLNDWFWFTTLWLLIVMSLERAMMVTQNRSRSSCSTKQAFLISTLVFGVCFVSALPEFWEYEVIETFDYGSNQTLVLTQLSLAAETPEYRIMYFWYTVSIIIFLPYPLFIILICVLSHGMKRSSTSRRRLSVKSGTGNILNRKVTEEIHLSRLFIVLILLYFLFTGPLTFLQLIDKLAPHWTWDSHLYAGLHNIFEFVFYFYYAIQFLLFCSYSDRFRLSLLRTCCCCCSSEWRPVQQRSSH